MEKRLGYQMHVAMSLYRLQGDESARAGVDLGVLLAVASSLRGRKIDPDLLS